MGNSLEYIISALDYATAPLKKVADAIVETSAKFTALRANADKMPYSLNAIKDKLKDIENAKGLTTSVQRLGELNTMAKTLNTTIQRLENLPPPGFFTRIREAGGAIFKLGPLIAGAFSIAAITSFGESVVETTSKYQKFEAVLTTQLQSASAGKEALEMIAKFASVTPFQVDEITASFVKLTAEGFTPTKEKLTSLGDLAASMGKSFDQVTEAVLRAGEGEYRRLKEFGVEAKKHGDKVEMTFHGQTKTIDATAEAMQRYVLGLGKMPGVVGSMAAISETTGGKISNLKDSVDYLKKGIGEGLKPVIDLVIDKIKIFTDGLQKIGLWMKAHPQEVKFFATTLAVVATALTAVTVGMWLFNAALWANPLTWVVIGVIALSAGIAYLITYFDGWGQSIQSLWSIIKSFAVITGLTFKNLWEGITYSMEIAWLKIKDFFQWIGEKISNVAEAIAKVAKFDFTGAYDSVNKKITTSASAEIDARQREHEGITGSNKSAIDSQFKSIGEEWAKVGVHASKDDKKDSPIEAAIKKISNGTGGGDGKAGKNDKGKELSSRINGGGAKNIYLTIHKLQDQIVVHTTNLQTGAKEAGKQIVEEILMALNSVNGKASGI